MPQVWAGVDAGKSHHHCVVIDGDGTRLLSRKIANDETEIVELLADVVELADGAEIAWATDLNQGGAALLISILVANDQAVLYLTGRSVHHAARTYRGDGKTDAKDAAIIADQARMRRDLHPVRVGDAVSTDLRLLTAHRTDLVHDRSRAINRVRQALLEFFPALEAAFDYSRSKGAQRLLTKYQTPDGIRRAGLARMTTWLRNNGAYQPEKIAERALAAARKQHTTVGGQNAGAKLVGRLAAAILRLNAEIAEVEQEIEALCIQHEHAELLMSIPGFGPILAAEFIATTGGTMDHFNNADHLAGVAGLAPVPRDSGRISGNNHRPRRYNRRLLRVCFMSAQVAAQHCPTSRAYYERKRGEGKNHKQAVLSLARRRNNVIWAMIRDHKTFKHQPGPALAAA